MRNKPKFAYFTEEGMHNSIIRKTIGAKLEHAKRMQKSRDRVHSQAKTAVDKESLELTDVDEDPLLGPQYSSKARNMSQTPKTAGASRSQSRGVYHAVG